MLQDYPSTLLGVLWWRYLAGNPSTDQLAILLNGCTPNNMVVTRQVSVEIGNRKDAGVIHAIAVLSHKQSYEGARDWAAKLILDQSKDPEHLTLALRADTGDIRAEVGEAMLVLEVLSFAQLFAIMESQVRPYHQDVVDAAALRVLECKNPSVECLAGVLIYAGDPLKAKASSKMEAVDLDTIFDLLLEDARKE